MSKEARKALSRRGFLRGGLGAGVGAAVGTRIAGREWIGEAKAAPDEPTAVLIVHFVGGFNALFASANTLAGRFGLSANAGGNWTAIGNGLAIDNTLATPFSAYVKQHMAAVGVRHGISNHPGARQALWSHQNQNAGLVLANAIGGNASIKAAVVGGNLVAEAPRGAVNGTSFQAITDMEKTIEALGGGPPGARTPDRGVAAGAMAGAQTMSDSTLAGSPGSLASLKNGYAAAVDTLKQPGKTFDFETLKTAYKLGNSTAVRNPASKYAAAELMIRSGTNVVTMFDGGWDSHGDTNGARVRTKMKDTVVEPLTMFLTRMVEGEKARNVTVILLGDFARSLPGSDHQPNLSALVIGKNVKQGTTGRTAQGAVSLAPNTPSIAGMWSLLGALSKVDSPFGKNQHPTLSL